MKDIDFFSSHHYIFLPTKKNLKVALAIDNSKLSYNAFKLYNPFSLKAKFFKTIMKICFKYFNILFKHLLSNKKEKSNFIQFLEKELHTHLVVSLYFATAKDKVVLQLQSKDAKIIGYLKYPINNIGRLHLANEIKAIEILSKKRIVKSYFLQKKYKGVDFLLLKELDGSIGSITKNNIDIILNKFQRSESYILSQHPRIIELKKLLYQHGMFIYIEKIESIYKNSTLEYKLVYEHGDFAPWNIVKVKEKYIPFDFEYFVEDGLEYLDMLKYYYQIGKLLKLKKDSDLVKYMQENINTIEFKELFQIFLIKEILLSKKEKTSYIFEENILKLMEQE